MKNRKCIFIVLILQLFFSQLLAEDFITIQATTSTENSGLLSILKEEFEKEFNFEIRFISYGTGQAIKSAQKGNCDAILVHSKDDEINFIKHGYGAKRYEIMYNDFIIVGPLNDPAKLLSSKNIKEVMHKIKLVEALFLSRDDNSGTHKKEISLWKKAGIEIQDVEKWYLKNGMGMGSTLNMASEINAYTLSDRATWLSFNNKNFINILYENDPFLINQYSVIPVNPIKFSHIKYDKVMVFINWLLSNKGKSTINGFTINGQQLFYAN